MRKRIECIDGLEYDKVIFRKELADLVRDALKERVDYIESVDINSEGVFIVNYKTSGRDFCYLDRYNKVAKKITEFIKVEQRDYILRELGI